MECSNLWLTGYTPDGYKVSITLAIVDDDIAGSIARGLEQIRTAGILPREMGVEEGEQVETVSAIVVTMSSSGGKETPAIDLYTGDFAYRTVTTYLNTPEDTVAFELACGVRLADLPVYEGVGHIKRRDNPKLDAKYVVPIATGARFVWKTNPNYKESDDDNKKPKRKFVRWHNNAPPAHAAPPPPPAQQAPAQQAPAKNDNGVIGGGKPKAANGNPVPPNSAQEREPILRMVCNRIEVKQRNGGNGKVIEFHGTDGTVAVAWSREGLQNVYPKDSAFYNSLGNVGTYIPLTTLSVVYQRNPERGYNEAAHVELAENADPLALM